MAHSLRLETYDAIIDRTQTSHYKLTEGEQQSVQSEFEKMIAGLLLWKVAEGHRIRKSKTIIRKIKKLSEVQVEYPPELLAARRAEFVRRVQSKRSS